MELEGEAYRYLFRVRRARTGGVLSLRNLEDDRIYTYRIENISRRFAVLVLEKSEILRVEPDRFLRMGWCQIDPKNVEKTLPPLNEMGVGELCLIGCEYSQGGLKYDFGRLRRILVNSSQQCGRSVMMKLETAGSLRDFLEMYPEAALLDFSPKVLPCGAPGVKTLVVGCEGGFSEKERSLFDAERIYGLNTPMVLRSESAVCAAASRILLG